jgi:putative holliday junction resolvase
MRTLAVDFGSRRIGLALSDAGGKLATPHNTLQVRSSAHTISQILKVVESEDVGQILVGLPLNMDGTHGPAAAAAVAFARDLQKASGKPTLLVDERLSTFAAEQQLIERKRAGDRLSRQKKKQRLDPLAAAILLQGFLDGHLKPLTPKSIPDAI